MKDCWDTCTGGPDHSNCSTSNHSLNESAIMRVYNSIEHSKCLLAIFLHT